jgi:hypothetical protein
MNRSITGGRRTRGRGRMVGGDGWFDTSSWGDTLNGWKRKATGYASGTDAGYDVQPMPEAAPMPEAVNMPAEAAPEPMPEQYPEQETPMGDMSSVGGRRRRRKSRKGRKSRKHTAKGKKRKSRGHGRRSRRGRR